MAWATPKQFAILNQDRKGKDIIQTLPKLTQPQFQSIFSDYIKNKPEKAEEEKTKEASSPSKFQKEEPITEKQPKADTERKQAKPDEQPAKKDAGLYDKYKASVNDPVSEKKFNEIVEFVKNEFKDSKNIS